MGRVGVAACVLVFVGCATEEPVTEQDLSVVFTASRLLDFGLSVPDGFEAMETISRERAIDGTTRITYEFTPPNDQPPVIHSVSEIHESASDACLSYNAMKIGVGFGGLETLPRSDYTYGEKSEFSTILNGMGKSVGNLFITCSEGRVQFTMIVGLHFDEASTWADAARPVLASLSDYSASRVSPLLDKPSRVSNR